MQYTLDKVLNFGRYKGLGVTVQDLLDVDSPDKEKISYVTWCILNVNWFTLDKTATAYYEQCKKKLMQKAERKKTKKVYVTLGDTRERANLDYEYYVHMGH